MYPKTQALISEFIQEEIFPGASFAFINPIEKNSYRIGNAAVYPVKEQIRDDQLYDLASVTKVLMTTTLILQLWEAGKLNLTDSVSLYLPAFSEPSVTIQHLLTHTSALNGFIENRDQLTAGELKEAMLHLSIGPDFGKKVVYTDTSMILLGFIVEECTKKNLALVFQERVSGPLKLNNTIFEPIDPLSCAPTENHPTRGIIRGVVHDPKAFTLRPNCGSAGLFSTIEDVSRFSQMLLNDGELDGVRLLKKETVEKLKQDWTPTGNLNRSLGWDFLSSGDKSHPKRYLFHSGFTGTFIFLDMIKKEGFVFLSNRLHLQNDTPHYLKRRNELLDVYIRELEEGQTN